MKTVYQCECCEYSSASKKAAEAHEERCKSLYDMLASLRKEMALGMRIGPEFESRIDRILEIKEKMKMNGS